MILTSSFWSQARFALSLLQQSSYDTATPEGRSKERYRRAALTTISSAVARGISVLTMLISVPLTVKYLGVERYALWVTAGSIIAMLVFADFGIGNGLLNAISETNGRDDRTSASRYVSSSFFMLLSIGLLTILLFSLVYPLIPWKRIFNLGSELAIREAGPSAAIFVGCFALGLPLGVVQRVQLGFQEGFATNLWSAAGSAMGLFGLLAVIHLRAGLPWLVLAMAGAPVLASLLNGLTLFGVQRPWLLPRFRQVSPPATKRVLHLGLLFFVLQVAGTVGYQSDNIILAQVLGTDKVTQYAVPARLFTVAPAMLSMLMMPLWPAYGEAVARGDVAWVSRTLKRSIVFGLVITVPANFVLVLFGSKIIRLWAGPQIAPSFALLAGLGIWGALSGLNWPLAIFLNGIGVVRFQAMCASLMAICSVCLSIFLARHIGISGPVYAMITAQVVCILIPLGFCATRLLLAIQLSKAEPPCTRQLWLPVLGDVPVSKLK